MQSNPLLQYYSHRLDALDALEKDDADALEESAASIRECAAFLDGDHLEKAFSDFAVALECYALGLRWSNAVRNAEANASRFLDAMRLRANEAIASGGASDSIQSSFETMAIAQNPGELAPVKSGILKTPLPFGVKKDDRGARIRTHIKDAEEAPPPLEVVFIKFDINDLPAKTIESLGPNRTYDIGMDVRLTRWPKNADRLILSPVSAEPEETYDLPTFVIEKPEIASSGEPITIERRGRLRIKAAAAMGARPFEFKYSAVFEPSNAEQALDVIGHRTLRFECLDPSETAISGYVEVDRKIFELRTELRRLPGIPDSDLGNALKIYAALGNLAGQALSDSLFAAGVQENEFQKEVVRALRARPEIGEALERHPQVGGGITDLSFHRIRIELKAVTDGDLDKSEIEKFAAQTAQYVVSSGKRLGVLCILDSRSKSAPPPPVEDHMALMILPVSSRQLPILVIRVQGGLARPSDLSR